MVTFISMILEQYLPKYVFTKKITNVNVSNKTNKPTFVEYRIGVSHPIVHNHFRSPFLAYLLHFLLNGLIGFESRSLSLILSLLLLLSKLLPIDFFLLRINSLAVLLGALLLLLMLFLFLCVFFRSRLAIIASVSADIFIFDCLVVMTILSNKS